MTSCFIIQGITKSIRLNETASIIWDLCDGERTIAQIITLLAASFPDEADRILEDVEATLRRFTDEGAPHAPLRRCWPSARGPHCPWS